MITNRQIVMMAIAQRNLPKQQALNLMLASADNTMLAGFAGQRLVKYFDKVKSSRDETKAKLEDESKTVSALNREKSNLEQSLAEKTLELESATTEISDLRREKEEVVESLGDVEAQLLLSQNENKEFESRQAEHVKSVEDLGSQLATKIEELDTTQSELTHTRERIDQLKLHKTSFEKNLRDEKYKHSLTSDKLERRDKRLLSVKADLEALKKTKAKVVASEKKRIDDLSREVSRLNSEIETLSAQVIKPLKREDFSDDFEFEDALHQQALDIMSRVMSPKMLNMINADDFLKEIQSFPKAVREEIKLIQDRYIVEFRKIVAPHSDIFKDIAEDD